MLTVKPWANAQRLILCHEMPSHTLLLQQALGRARLLPSRRRAEPPHRRPTIYCGALHDADPIVDPTDPIDAQQGLLRHLLVKVAVNGSFHNHAIVTGFDPQPAVGKIGARHDGGINSFC